MSEATARPARWRVFAPDTAGAIYGTIAAMAVIAGTAADPGHGKALSLTVATLFVFWLAHVYAQTLSHHLKGARRLEWSAVKAAMVEERPLLEGPLPLLVVLALGELHVLEGRTGIRLALWIGVGRAGHLGHPLRAPAAVGLAGGDHRGGGQRAVRAGHRAPRGGRALTGITAARSRPRPPAGPAGAPGTR